jgi:hypothetical protein
MTNIRSDRIDAAVAAGGELIAALQDHGPVTPGQALWPPCALRCQTPNRGKSKLRLNVLRVICPGAAVRRWQKELERLPGVIALELTNGGHIRLRLTNGRFVFCSSSPSDFRAIRNTEALVRRELRKQDYEHQ